MAGEDGGLFSREEVLGGAAGRVVRRASATLFQIEAKTAHLAARDRYRLVPIPSEAKALDRELSFLEAYALGRELPAGTRPSVQDLDRFAPDWADLVAADPRLRAAVANLIGRRYRLVAGDDRGIRAALGLDDPAVRAAYRRMYGEEVDTISTSPTTLSPLERFRWRVGSAIGRLNRLPPFWTAYAFTLTETVGAGILALPIALAGIGPLAGVVLLAVFGLVNVMTVATIAETMTRTGSVRFEGAYFRRVVGEYLGSAGSIALTLSIVGICVVAVLSYYIGLSSTLRAATGVPAPFWMVVLFAVSTYMVTRDRLDSTIASALVVGGTNLMLILALSVLALGHLDLDNLTSGRVPGLNGEPFDADVSKLIFGVILLAYFGHLSAGNAASVVLRRDASGRALMRGAALAQLSAMAIYCLWVVAVGGAVDRDELIGRTGTALEPLAEVAGPLVDLAGSIFVVLGMGMGTVHLSMALANAVRDWLPRRKPPVVTLSRGRTWLSFRPRRDDRPDRRLEVAYLGLDGGGPRLRFRTEMGSAVHLIRPESGAAAVAGFSWDATPVLAALPGGAGLAGLELRLEVLTASEEQIELKVISSWPVGLDGSWERTGVDLLAALDGGGATGGDGSESDEALLRWLLRRGSASAAEVAAWTGANEAVASERLRALVAGGVVAATDGPGGPAYRARLVSRRGRRLTDDLDRALASLTEDGAPSGDGDRVSPSGIPVHSRKRLGRIRELLEEERARAVLAVLPAAAIFLIAEWLVLSDTASYAAVLGFGGVISASLCAGVFPVLMLAAARRKGDLLPTVVPPVLGHPAMLMVLYAIFLLGIVLHGAVIWQTPALRIGALAVAAGVIALTVIVARRGAFAPRAVVAIRHDRAEGDQARFTILCCGRPATARVDLADDRSLVVNEGTLSVANRVRFTLPEAHARDLKVIAHRIGDAGTEALPLVVQVDTGDGRSLRLDPRPTGGQVLVPMSGSLATVEILPADELDEKGGGRSRRPGRGKHR